LRTTLSVIFAVTIVTGCFFNPFERHESGVFTIQGKIAPSSYKEKSIRVMLHNISGLTGQKDICHGDWMEIKEDGTFSFKTPKITYYVGQQHLGFNVAYAHQGPPRLKFRIDLFRVGKMPITITVTPQRVGDRKKIIDLGLLDLDELETLWDTYNTRSPKGNIIMDKVHYQCRKEELTCHVHVNDRRSNCDKSPLPKYKIVN